MDLSRAEFDHLIFYLNERIKFKELSKNIYISKYFVIVINYINDKIIENPSYSDFQFYIEQFNTKQDVSNFLSILDCGGYYKSVGIFKKSNNKTINITDKFITPIHIKKDMFKFNMNTLFDII